MALSASASATLARISAAAASLAASLAGCVRLGDLRVADDLRDALAPDRREVVRVVGDVLDLEDVEVQPKLQEVLLDLGRERVGELEAVLVDLLGRERREHAPQVALERLLRHLLHVAEPASQEALDGVHDDVRIRRQLDDGDGTRTLSGMPTFV